MDGMAVRRFAMICISYGHFSWVFARSGYNIE
uniref:Uncharacterized protein n=1 Tax=Arundo donax TaxID=35708 RepID=A0A0A9DF04_ARUDO